MKDKAPEDVEEVDIENMSMEELREFIAAAEAEVTNMMLLRIFKCLLSFRRKVRQSQPPLRS